MFNPRSVALQGIGFGALAIALQGFAPSQVQATVIETPRYSTSVDAALAQSQRKKQQLIEEDAVILAALHLFVMEA